MAPAVRSHAKKASVVLYLTDPQEAKSVSGMEHDVERIRKEKLCLNL